MCNTSDNKMCTGHKKTQQQLNGRDHCRVHARPRALGSRWKRNWWKSKQIWSENFHHAVVHGRDGTYVLGPAWSSPNCLNIPLFRRWWRRNHSKRQLGWGFRGPYIYVITETPCVRCPPPSLNISAPGEPTAGGEEGAGDGATRLVPPARVVQPQHNPARTNSR